MSGIKITAEDRKFSKMIRERDNWTCQRCGKEYVPPTKALHCCHCFTRGIKFKGPDGVSLRVNPDNATSWCYGCHAYMDARGDEKYAWFRDRIGDERFEAIAAIAHQKRDRA